MKPIKMFGLAALVALLAMAFVGASSAAAESTELCAGEGEFCATITHVHETSVGKGVLKSSLPTIECNVLFLGDVEEGTSAPLVINGQFTYSSCNNFCTVKEESAGATIEVLRTASELGSVTGEGLVNVSCPFINCNYIGKGLSGHALGPLTSEQANGSVTIKEAKTEKESGSCPKEAFLTLTTTPLVPTYIREARLHYCVEYEHNTNGFYKDNKCTEGPVAGRAFDLVSGPNNGAAGQAVCVAVSAGLWKKINATTQVCEEDAATLTGGIFEKGTIRTVQ